MIILCFEYGIYGNEVRIFFLFMESKLFYKFFEVVKDVYIIVKVIWDVCLVLIDS